MLGAQVIQVGSDTALDILTALLFVATGVMAFATLRLARQTRKSVSVAEEAVAAANAEAEASAALVAETRADRELAVQPFLILTDNVNIGPGGPEVQLRNIGRGPAIRTRILWAHAGEVFWNAQAGLAIASGETYPPGYRLVLTGRRGASSISPDIVGSSSPADRWVHCLDQLGNRLRFNLQTGAPPEVARRGERLIPAWVDTWDW
jgi:hypothetical protein